jgi:tight adherence protein C
MIEVALGALLGLGLFVLVSGSAGSRLVQQLAPHIRDVASVTPITNHDSGAERVVQMIAAVPRALFGSRKRTRRSRTAITDELPAVLDVIGICVAAGMTIPGALERVGQSGRGELPTECRTIVAEIALGVSISDAIHASVARVSHDGWTRLIEHLDIARRHGTPIVEIVRSLAEDEQHAAGQRLLESASARETLMMFPLVFIILPVTVIMAIFPGVTALGSLSL